jgi:peptide/nickel transport system ATP-binding protein
MKGGRIVEIDVPQKLFNDAQHAYTQPLISATPVFAKRLGN